MKPRDANAEFNLDASRNRNTEEHDRRDAEIVYLLQLFEKQIDGEPVVSRHRRNLLLQVLAFGDE